jgi:hypothetical protein
MVGVARIVESRRTFKCIIGDSAAAVDRILRKISSPSAPTVTTRYIADLHE